MMNSFHHIFMNLFNSLSLSHQEFFYLSDPKINSDKKNENFLKLIFFENFFYVLFFLTFLLCKLNKLDCICEVEAKMIERRSDNRHNTFAQRNFKSTRAQLKNVMILDLTHKTLLHKYAFAYTSQCVMYFTRCNKKHRSQNIAPHHSHHIYLTFSNICVYIFQRFLTFVYIFQRFLTFIYISNTSFSLLSRFSNYFNFHFSLFTSFFSNILFLTFKHSNQAKL